MKPQWPGFIGTELTPRCWAGEKQQCDGVWPSGEKKNSGIFLLGPFHLSPFLLPTFVLSLLSHSTFYSP
jgi:hypothetical protein